MAVVRGIDEKGAKLRPILHQRSVLSKLNLNRPPALQAITLPEFLISQVSTNADLTPHLAIRSSTLILLVMRALCPTCVRIFLVTLWLSPSFLFLQSCNHPGNARRGHSKVTRESRAIPAYLPGRIFLICCSPLPAGQNKYRLIFIFSLFHGFGSEVIILPCVTAIPQKFIFAMPRNKFPAGIEFLH